MRLQTLGAPRALLPPRAAPGRVPFYPQKSLFSVFAPIRHPQGPFPHSRAFPTCKHGCWGCAAQNSGRGWSVSPPERPDLQPRNPLEHARKHAVCPLPLRRRTPPSRHTACSGLAPDLGNWARVRKNFGDSSRLRAGACPLLPHLNTCCARNAAPTPRRAPDDTKPAPGAQPDPPPQLGAWQQNKERAPRFSRRHLPLRPLDHVPEVAVAPPSSLPIKQTTPNALVKTLIRCFQTTMQTFSAERKARPVPRPNASGGPRCGRAPFCPGTRAALEHPQARDKGAPPSFDHAGSGGVLISERGLVVSAAGSRKGGGSWGGLGLGRVDHFLGAGKVSLGGPFWPECAPRRDPLQKKVAAG